MKEKIKTKRKKIFIATRHTLRNIIRTFVREKKNFITHDTSGSIRIIHGDVEYCYVGERKGNKGFKILAVYNRLKSNILTFPEKNIPDFSRKLTYWKINNKMASSKELMSIINIDIKKAYPCALFNKKFINKTMLNYILSFDKMGDKESRLRGVGMLGRKKLIQYYKKGKPVTQVLNQDKYLRKVFFYVCKEIDKIMLKCYRLCGKDVVFFWFDGIYIINNKKTKSKIRNVKKTIRECGYKYSSDVLKNFICSHQGNNLSIRFEKDGKEKSFLLPLEDGLKQRID